MAGLERERQHDDHEQIQGDRRDEQKHGYGLQVVAHANIRKACRSPYPRELERVYEPSWPLSGQMIPLIVGVFYRYRRRRVFLKKKSLARPAARSAAGIEAFHGQLQ